VGFHRFCSHALGLAACEWGLMKSAEDPIW